MASYTKSILFVLIAGVCWSWIGVIVKLRNRKHLADIILSIPWYGTNLTYFCRDKN